MPEPITITEAAGFVRAGEITPSELLEQCLARIDRYEERVRAWVYLDREGAREQAARLSAELKQGNYRGPLHGIPVGIKDIIDVFDMPTGCGSKLWAQSYARRDATVVERLRQAGAVIMGKTVTTAFASFDPPVTRNPWNLGRTPGGSSSGSAAAVACGMCLGALATQTGGSITRPASYCGVYSLKPTYGGVSVDGVLPLAPSLDHVGVMANCVLDLAILFQVIAGPDNRDPGSTRRAPQAVVPAVSRATGDDRFSLYAGRVRGLFDREATAEVSEVVEAVCGAISKRDGNVSDIRGPESLDAIPMWHRTMMAVEAAAYHLDRLTRHPEDYPPRIRELIEEGLACPAPQYAACRDNQRTAIQQLRPLFEAFPILLTPATPAPPPEGTTTGNPLFNSVWSFLRIPTVSVPAAWTAGGLPISVQLVGYAYREDEVLAAAAALEQLVGFARRPVPL